MDEEVVVVEEEGEEMEETESIEKDGRRTRDG